MRYKFFKTTVTFIVMLGILFSNIPYNALSFLIGSLEKSSGIVDKIWLLQNEHDGNVVDNFASIKNIAEKMRINDALAIANFQAAGTAVKVTTATASPTWPTHQINDVALLFVETANQAVTLTTPNGFVAVTNSPQYTGTAGAAGGVRLSVFWARATSASMAAPVIAATTNHAYAQIVTFRGVVTSGDPFDGTAGAVTATAATTSSFPTITTTMANDLIVLAAATDVDSTSAQWSAWTNSAITSLAEKADGSTTNGAGGGIGVASGQKVAAGAVGASTGTHTSGVTAQMTIALKADLTTTLATGSDPAATNIAPGAAATDVNQFTLTSTVGTETINSVTVNLSTNSGIGTLAITNSSNTVLGSTASPVTGSNTINVSSMTAGTTVTTFKVRVTPLSHSAMPVPPGGAYAITAPVTAWVGAGGYTHAGSDTNANALTIGNDSPNGATSVSSMAGNNKATLNWTTSNSADFNTVGGSVVYRWANTSAGAEVPAEGSSPVLGSTNGTATVACLVSSAASTVLSRVDGAGGSTDCTTVALTNGQSYTYKVFEKDLNSNFDTGTLIGTTNYSPNNPPTTVLNNPTDGSTISSATPSLEMTATDPNNDQVLYNIQISTSSSFATTSNIIDKTSAKKIWVATGGLNTNSIAYSYDGLSWTPDGPSPIFSSGGFAVASNGNMFVAVGYGTNNTIAYSYDGIHWTGEGTSMYSVGRGVAWNGSMWVSGGTGTNSMAYSYDGINWTGVSGTSIFTYAYGFAWNGSMWLATGSGTTYSMASSPDGINWTALAGSKTLFSTLGYTPAWNGSMWESGGYGSNALAYSTTANATSWMGTGATVFSTGAFGVTWNGSMWVATGNDATYPIKYSSNGIDWTGVINSKTLIPTGEYGQTVAWDGSMWLAGAQSVTNSILYSNNGTTWYGEGAALFSQVKGITSNSPVNMNPPIINNGGIDFVNTVTPANTNLFNSGEKVSYTVPVSNALPVGTYYWRVRAVDPAGSNTMGAWSTARSFNITPSVTSYVNNTEAGLNSSASCTTCGARIGGGAGFRQSVTITGTGFGTDPGAANRSSAANHINIGTHQIANSNVISWSNTSITFYTDSAVTGDTDADWGTEYGGTGDLTVTVNSVPSTGFNFYLFPNVTSLTVPTATADAAREYAAGDTDGVITLNGTRLGATATGGWVRFFGCDNTTCSSPSGSAATNSWSNTAIVVQVPAVIADNIYTGSVVMQQGSGSYNNTETYTASGFRVLPRVTSLSPTSGPVGSAITLTGNHLCQNNGTCPVAFDTNNKVTFNSGIAATVFTSWSNTAIVTVVPSGTTTGNVNATSNTYVSNNNSFSLVALTTTLASGSDPAVNTIAPGAATTDVNQFTLQTNSGSETITSVTVNLSTNSGVGTLAITDNANTVLGSTNSSVTGSNIITVSGMTAGTSATTFKVRVTPLSHSAMPAVPGAAYAITAPVTAWAGSNSHTGSDTNTNALTIDNASPNGATLVSGTAGDAKNTVNWTTSNSADSSGSVIYRWAAASAGAEVPVEGSIPTIGSINGTATVACVVSSGPSNPMIRVDGTGAGAECTTAALTNGQAYTYKIFQKDNSGNYSAGVLVGTFTPVSAASLIIGKTSGYQNNVLLSGNTSQYINMTNCTDESTCSAFKLTATSGPAVITSIKIAETGTVSAYSNLSNPTLVYDTDSNFSNGTTGTFGSQTSFASDDTVTFSNAGLTIPSGSTYYFYVRFDLASGTNYPVAGQTILFQINSLNDVISSITKTGTAPIILVSYPTQVFQQITSFTNNTEAALSSVNCPNCGVRIGPGAGFRQTATINGFGFGTDPGLGQRSTDTNHVSFGSLIIKDDGSGNTNVTSWSNTSITIRTDTNVVGNSDTDWGIIYSGSLFVYANTIGRGAGLFPEVFPQVTSITVPTVNPDSAREYNASDSDGLVTINGTRFGSSIGTGWVRFLGCDSSTCSSPSGTATINSWSSTAVTAQVPSVIADNVYTGSLVIQQWMNNQSYTYTNNGFRILPRITSLNPVSGSAGDAIVLNGNHLCQNNAICPVIFDASNKVTFNSGVAASTFTSWNNTSISTVVPAGTTTGNIFSASNSFLSNYLNFTVVDPTPSDPTSLGQYSDSFLTTPLSVGGISSSTSIYLAIAMQAGVSGGTLYPQFEIEPLGSAFGCVGTGACALAADGSGKSGPGPINCNLSANACFVSVSAADLSFHWQTRVRHNKGGTNYYSNWVSFGGNSENAADFQIDKTGPIVTFSGANTCSDAAGTPTTNGANIAWTLNEAATGQVEFSKNSALTSSSFFPLTPNSPFLSQSLSASNLDSGTTYYFRVKSTDAAGNTTIRPASEPYCSFTTATVNQPAKTTKFYVGSMNGTLAGGAATSSSFAVYVPESSISVVNAFVELTGTSPKSGTNNITLSINGSGQTVFPVASGNNSFRILYPVSSANLNFNPVSNTFNISPSLDLNITSAELVLTYSYTP